MGVLGGDTAIAGSVTCGGEGAAGAEVGGDDVVGLGGVTGGTGKHKVLSGDWAIVGLARLGLGEDCGDLGPRTGVATASAACVGPAVTATSAA